MQCQRRQKRVLHILDLELQTAVSHHVRDENWIQVLSKSSQWSNWAISPAQDLICVLPGRSPWGQGQSLLMECSVNVCRTKSDGYNVFTFICKNRLNYNSADWKCWPLHLSGWFILFPWYFFLCRCMCLYLWSPKTTAAVDPQSPPTWVFKEWVFLWSGALQGAWAGQPVSQGILLFLPPQNWDSNSHQHSWLFRSCLRDWTQGFILQDKHFTWLSL